MSNFFQHLKSVGRSAGDGGEPRLILAAFGKHPGWDDHMPGIGVETEVLAQVKQTLYVGGIGRQVDSGAWEKLEPEKRVEGFDHVFLWQRANHVLLGELWSSRDGRGRSKYPMVLCVDGEGVSPDYVLERAYKDLERLREACLAATTAEQVTAECQAAQNRLNEPKPSVQIELGTPASIETRRQFLAHPDVGPDQIGLLRILHELRMALPADSGRSRSSSKSSPIRLCHLRVPAADNSGTESLALWAAFFASALPQGAPILLISRKKTSWLDVIVGEPESDDFFCLGAGLKAIPLTTQIPYDLSPDLKALLAKVESQFLEGEPVKEIAEPRPTVPAPAPPFVTPPASKPPPAANQPPVRPPVIPEPAKKRNWLLPVVIGVVAVAGAGGFWLVQTTHKSRPTAGTEASATPSASTNAVGAKGSSPSDDAYAAAMKDARAALSQQDFATAISKANEALDAKAGDTNATQLKAEAQAKQLAMETQAASEESYKRAFNAARDAYQRGNYTAAVSQATMALQIKTNDAPASKLRTEAQAQLDASAAAAAQQKQKYQAAMTSGQAALDRKDFSGAIAQAQAALAIKANDLAAMQLEAAANSGAKTAAMEKEHQKEFDARMAEAREAFENKDYSNAVLKANEALNLNANDTGAALLKREAAAAQQKALALSETEANYQKFLTSAQAAYSAGDYSNAVAQAQAAQAVRPNDSAAADLQQKAATAQDLQDAKAAAARGDFEKARRLCSAHAGVADFDALAGKLKGLETEKLAAELEIYQVRFGLLDPQKATNPEARRETEWLGELTIGQRDQCLKNVQLIRQGLQSVGQLDTVRDKQLKDLKEIIDHHL